VSRTAFAKKRKEIDMKGMELAIAATALVAAIILGFSHPVSASDKVTVFAAASLTNAVTDIGRIFDDKKQGAVAPSFAASSALARQIEHGAPANVFISADEKWMDYLSKRGFVVRDTVVNLLGNRIVLIAPTNSKLALDVKPGFPLAKILGSGLLAVGDPDHVPAGRYAKAALQKLGVWTDVENKLARADNVRAALALVERGECSVGIVYATDAAISKKVKVLATFPQDSHAPITYPAALVSGKDTPAARSFLDFLKTSEAKAVFEKYGFTVH
jgi:molybdate transport system substrate-binding protein